MANAFFMEQPYDEIHIGRIIQMQLKAQGRSVKWFAEQIPCTRNHLYKIFRSSSLHTDLLLRISVVLNYNFFKHYETALKQNNVYQK